MRKIYKISRALSSETRLKILKIIGSSSLTLSEITEKFNNSYHTHMYKESIYRELEQMVNAGILRKKYYQKDKKLKYEIAKKEIIINLGNLTVKEVNKDTENEEKNEK
ncbi:MAG: helix-turn-helix transcriptional regulator [Nitrososphaeria archaeon]|nr:helix-turn-helix transcriptional regulator [Nitrososphaeria archaeon]